MKSQLYTLQDALALSKAGVATTVVADKNLWIHARRNAALMEHVEFFAGAHAVMDDDQKYGPIYYWPPEVQREIMLCSQSDTPRWLPRRPLFSPLVLLAKEAND